MVTSFRTVARRTVALCDKKMSHGWFKGWVRIIAEEHYLAYRKKCKYCGWHLPVHAFWGVRVCPICGKSHRTTVKWYDRGGKGYYISKRFHRFREEKSYIGNIGTYWPWIYAVHARVCEQYGIRGKTWLWRIASNKKNNIK